MKKLFLNFIFVMMIKGLINCKDFHAMLSVF